MHRKWWRSLSALRPITLLFGSGNQHGQLSGSQPYGQWRKIGSCIEIRFVFPLPLFRSARTLNVQMLRGNRTCEFDEEMDVVTRAAPTALIPRFIRLRDAPRYLGMDKNRFKPRGPAARPCYSNWHARDCL